MTTNTDDANLSYQSAPAVSGGSYTENKLKALQLPPLAGKRFLDLGCNAGFYCGQALQQGAKRVVGVDLDAKVIQKAREMHPCAEFFDGGWDRFPAGEFDVIICLSAIHYASDPIRLVDEVRSHLSPDGVFVLEGGLVNADDAGGTDILIPSWRQVGDRCRHLSRGYVANHLLRSFTWSIVGKSEKRGGDPVPRVVIHAAPGPVRLERDAYHLDLLEYARCLALSAESIVAVMPSYSYVTALGSASSLSAQEVEALLADPQRHAAFMSDLLFAIGLRRPARVTLAPTLSASFLSDIADRLRADALEVVLAQTSSIAPESSVMAPQQQAESSACKIAKAAGTTATSSHSNIPITEPHAIQVSISKCRPMRDYVPVLQELPNNADQGQLKGRIAVDLGINDPELHRVLLAQGVERCYVVAKEAATFCDPRLLGVTGEPWDAPVSGADVVFFDARAVAGMDSVHDIIRMTKHMRGVLAPTGSVFAILQTGYASPDFDVFNSVVLSPNGPIPTSSYLIDEILREFAVRILDHPSDQEPMVTHRLIRLTIKKPTLLLVFGQSQSGKTSLAREFKALDSHGHVTNDYLYFEIVRLKSLGYLHSVHPALFDHVGDGSGAACGQFNRRLDTDVTLLGHYLDLLKTVLPGNKSLVTIDFDLRRPEQYEIVKRYFQNAGYSTWVVTR